MDLMQRLINETRRTTLKIGNTYYVYITHVNNPHSFYARPWGYNQYMKTVQTRGDHVTKSELKIGSIVIYESDATNDFVRGKIILIQGEDDITCDLFALDVGCVERCVPIEKMWKPYHQVNLPPLALHCQLGNCVPRAERWLDTTIAAMRGFVQGELAQIKIKNIMPEVTIVEVCISCPDDLATLLAITRHTTFDYMGDLDYPLAMCVISRQYYSERILQVKSVLHVRLQSGAFLDKFFAAPLDEYTTYLKDQEEYTAYAETQRALRTDQLKLKTPVGIFYHRTQRFERGLVREINNNKNTAKVELVDWGKMIEESAELMRPIPEQYLSNPPLGIYCGLHASQYSKSCTSEISKLAHLSNPGVEFFIKFEEVSDDYNTPNMVTVFGIAEL